MAPRGSVAGGTLCALLGGAVRSLPRAPVAALQVDDPLGGIGAVCPILRRQREKAVGQSLNGDETPLGGKREREVAGSAGRVCAGRSDQ